ncbi:hypothetical protein COW36_07525 [bacterium (Candidatus Blackallbacteria) CG17_big_fil_post_rev_8_21_14_2_50_48_46]|uniref:Uncharacterized protein n=1 Tax=bacterium (Candidatus Blackallbacteria) CG17_big_fil_post_rev_8_21_14_2_50_48_46 TaxID=2014261 RepID=A0A2M7G7S1_9BACT|nr:MAG: hypothetical protein COW64_16625 [bacterium (Candidatus Blackallbacteria) CG18_big_fil_WC_8_21_14_2_50_49_26]PIW17786.1 MAG: hypothetical protein COW36_07525 [bacterium (Candidatus Blackallbacteria) CG17_big_fil_post_rev_8_21_14_2_50_48_46]PIW47345.1 MAG: hypothetical protein COW20_13050 [bacterium (Candidatus Blackallbacteria) CG13_big_fil_rev_8_21_14_2_50_49_14]
MEIQPTPLSQPQVGRTQQIPAGLRVGSAPATTQTPQPPQDRHTAASVLPGQAAPQLSFIENTDPPSREELNWALELEQKIKQGYAPNSTETTRYTEISNRLQTSQDASDPNSVTQAEVNWALELESKTRSGHPPSAQELNYYQSIAQKRFQADQEPKIPELKTVSPQELDWAQALMKRVSQIGYKPSQQEIEHYTDIYNRYQAEQAHSTSNAPSAEEIQWAQSLAQKIQAGYPPLEAETSKYIEIQTRFETNKGQDSLSKSEIQWMLDFRQKVADSYQPLEAELDKYSQLLDQAMAQDATLIDPAEAPLTQHEIDWANRLQEKVKAGYAPQPGEEARYQEIYSRFAK